MNKNQQQGMKHGQNLSQSYLLWGPIKLINISKVKYKTAKDQNKTTWENFQSLSYSKAFDEKLGLHIVMVMLYLKEVGLANQKAVKC